MNHTSPPIKQTLIKYIATFLILISLFVLLLTLVYCIPNDVINNRRIKAFDYFKEVEDWYPEFFWETQAARLDNATDYTMIERNATELLDDNPFISAMYAGDYSRYWHGYQVILRPLLRFFDIQHIRHITMITFFVLICSTFSMLQKKLGFHTALCFLLSLCPLYPSIVSISLQFMSVFVIMFLAILYLLIFYDTNKLKDVPLYFMVIGMITNFVDFLTAPLLTLGMPFIIYLSLTLKHKPSSNLFEILKEEFSCIFTWFCGYGFCWASKWIIASAFLENNIILDAFNSILLRTMGNEVEPANRLEMLQLNFSNMFYSQGIKITVVYFFVAITLLVLAIVFHQNTRSKTLIIPFFILAVLPYVWFIVLGNHSYIHAWFTYRIQAITLFCLFTLLNHFIDWIKIKNCITNILNIRSL